MKVKVFVTLIVITGLLTVVAAMPAQTYVPGADELSQVIGGWMENKHCEDNERCTGDDDPCPSDGCDGKSAGDACGSTSEYWDRDGCVTKSNYRCKYDDFIKRETTTSSLIRPIGASPAILTAS